MDGQTGQVLKMNIVIIKRIRKSKRKFILYDSLLSMDGINYRCTRRCTIISVLSAISFVIALVIILPILLVKQNTTLTTTPRKYMS